ncbi:ATP-dependent 23S rRNA helicase DbpA [hydrothermal vent metagenome]|uniref:ATP-dependent 23S rRNA helicase DbpA n=1 Tax=hydrothermal vent metagenome TaxID=652676 RepID=A0A1W1EAE3_9ZZZZ
MHPFHTLPSIPTPLTEKLSSLDLHTMTPVQAECIPAILAGKDLIVQSKTGSGKTLAFGIPVVIEADSSKYLPQTLVITPTRELAEQVAVALREIAAFKPNLKILTLYGGTPLRVQADSLHNGAHILIGTPGRLLDHLSKETMNLSGITRIVLDEADRMLDMGFYDDILKIISRTFPKHQTLLFSATFSPKIEQLATSLLHTPQIIKVQTEHETQKIAETYYETDEKFKTLKSLIGHYTPDSLLIFANTKSDVTALAQRLQAQQHSVIALHGDLDQTERNEAVIMFANGSRRIMVATDIASRGLDIKGIDMVINYDLPFDKEVYIHRIGRTGRADASGIAVSLTGSHINPKTAYIRECARQGNTKVLHVTRDYPMQSNWVTLCLGSGKRDKLRKGDILGTLCKEIGIENEDIGKMELNQNRSYIALHHHAIDKVLKALKNGVKIKKRKVKGWVL